MKVAGSLLTAGFVCTAVGAGLLPFVMMFGLLGGLLLCVALILLFSAPVVIWPRDPIPLWRLTAGMMLYLPGALGLILAAAESTNLAYNQAMGPRPAITAPTPMDWILVGLIPFLPGMLITLGLRLRAQLPWSHCFVWGFAGMCVIPIALVLFWLLTPMLPLTA